MCYMEYGTTVIQGKLQEHLTVLWPLLFAKCLQ